MKRVTEYIGAEYKQGGDICSTTENEMVFVITLPVDPQPIPTATTVSNVQNYIFREEINLHIKQISKLCKNMQKAYSPILGKWIELLKVKLKQ